MPAGATAFVPALVASGLPNEKFCFEGLSSPEEGKADAPERTLRGTPHHHLLRVTFPAGQDIDAVGPSFSAWIALFPYHAKYRRYHEETVRGTLEEVIAHFTVNEPKGEIVIVLAGLKDKKDKETEKDV